MNEAFVVEYEMEGLNYKGVVYIENGYYGLMLFENGHVISNNILKDNKIRIPEKESKELVRNVVKKLIERYIFDLNRKSKQHLLIVRKICQTCKYWSGRRVFGCTSANCDLHFKNMNDTDSCVCWEY